MRSLTNSTSESLFASLGFLRICRILFISPGVQELSRWIRMSVLLPSMMSPLISLP